MVIEEIKAKPGNYEKIRFMFQDEARFGRVNVARKCWAPRGTRPRVGSQIIREYTYAYAAVSPADGIMDSLILPEVNASIFELFLREISSRHLSEYIVMFMDGASWHKTKKLELPDNMKILFIPPYSPELNPTEHLWDCIRENWFPNRTFKSMDAVENTLVDALVALEDDHNRVQRLTGFNWIVNDIMNAT